MHYKRHSWLGGAGETGCTRGNDFFRGRSGALAILPDDLPLEPGAPGACPGSLFLHRSICSSFRLTLPSSCLLVPTVPNIISSLSPPLCNGCYSFPLTSDSSSSVPIFSPAHVLFFLFLVFFLARSALLLSIYPCVSSSSLLSSMILLW